MDQRQAQPDEIFCAALELASAERGAYLDRVCRGEVALRQRVERLLEAHSQAHGFLAERPAIAAQTTDSVIEGAGALLGLYKLLEPIGEGGFGEVFLAEQQQPIRRKVALKVLKRGMDTRHVVARFEAERQALAIMDHPNIARVFDGGATPSGRPYFVMELVKGMPITDYCDQNQLTLRQRLELLVHVCQAVQHAHQKGIIHRDLKPSNVLISRHDTTPVVKVIDFGVAKALGQELTDKTLFTGIAQMIGTPLYMSPEQAGMSDLDIDTRCDIYSLGVLMYELLTGTTPFAKERFKRASYDEIRRIIREDEPPKPSTRLSESRETLVSISAQRQTEPAKLTKLVRYELDWIVMKALEKDRNRRYETANGFAMDVQRYLADEPVLACPPSVWYRFRKFATRNKAALSTAALLATSLVLIIVILTVSNVTIAQERDQKDQALKEKEAALTQAKHNEAAANDERRRAEENAKLATKVLDEIIMQEASRRVDLYRKDNAKRVSVDAEREKQEIDFLKKGLTFYEQLAQTNNTGQAARREKARAYRQIGWLQHLLGKEEESVQAFRQAIRLWEQLAAESSGDFDSQYSLADAWHWLFSILWNQHLLHDADAANRRARELFDKLVEQYPKDPRCMEGRADCQLHWAYVLMNTQRLTEANDALLRCRALWQELSAAFPTSENYRWHVCDTYWYSIDVLKRQGKLSEAIDAGEKAVSLWENMVVAFNYQGHRSMLAGSLDLLGDLLVQDKQYQAAEKCYQKVFPVWQQLVAEFNLPEYRTRLGLNREHLGHLLKVGDRLYEAERAYREAVAVWQKLVTDFHEEDHRLHLCDIRATLAENLLAQGKHADAAKVAEEVPATSPHEVSQYHRAADLLARCVSATEKDAKRTGVERKRMAQAYDRRSRELRREAATRSPDSPRTQNLSAWFLTTCPDLRFRDPVRAIELAQKAVKGSPKSASYWNTLGVARYRAGQYQEAIADLEMSIKLDQFESSYNGFFLALAHWNFGNKAEARRWYEKAVDWMNKNKRANEELDRFRTEAAELLGIKDKKD